MTKKLIALFLALTLCLGLTLPAMAETPSYSDVPDNHWAHDAIVHLTNRGIASGTGSNNFSPDGQVTTGQFITMTTRAFYKEAVEMAESPVEDWWGKNMFVAHLSGLLAGTNAAASETPLDNGKVQWDSAVVDAPMNRYEMAQVMYNYIWSIMDTPSARDLELYKDKIPEYKNIPSQYQTAVLNVYALNCLSGVDATGRFAGDQLMSRAQAAVVLERLIMLKETGTDPAQPDAEPEATPDPAPSDQPSFGKPPADTNNDGVVTEEEVIAALAVLKEKYPEGYPWGSGDSYTSPIMGAGIECAGWAYMASDSIFSSTAPSRTLSDIKNLRVGDLVYVHTSTIEHWAVVTEVGDEFYFLAEGNYNGTVHWSGYGSLSGTANLMSASQATIYTRYPV